MRLISRDSRRRRFTTFLAASLASVGCLPALYKGHMTRAADGWSIEVRAITDSLKSVQVSGEPAYAFPPKGYHWVWVFMNVRNTAAEPRVFVYDNCRLGDQTTESPSFAGSVMSLYEDHVETFAPGAESYRRVIFAYPDGRTPRTFRCANVQFEIPPQSGSHHG